MNMMKIDTTRKSLAAETTDRSRGPMETNLIRHRVSELLAGTRQAILEHNGQDYRLRITSNGKLILTK